MDVTTVRALFDYNRWANGRLLAAAEELPTEELDRDLRGSFASLKGTLRHLIWAERGWLRFWKNDDFGPDLSPEELTDLPAIVREWGALESEKDAFLGGLTDAKLAAPRKVDENGYVLGELLQHCVNHSTHHRGQVVLMLRQLGKTPPGTGFRQFLTESRRP